MSSTAQTNNMELFSGSGTLSMTSVSATVENYDSPSEEEQAVAITIACVFIVLVVGFVAGWAYVTRKRRLGGVNNGLDEEGVQHQEATVNVLESPEETDKTSLHSNQDTNSVPEEVDENTRSASVTNV